MTRRRIGGALFVAGLAWIPSCSGTTTDTRSADETLASQKTYYCGQLCATAVRCGFSEPDPTCESSCEAYVEEGIAEAPQCSDETLAWLGCFATSGCTFSPRCIDSEDVMEDCRRGNLGVGLIGIDDGGAFVPDGGGVFITDGG